MKKETARTPNEPAETSYVDTEVVRNKFTELLRNLESMLPNSFSLKSDLLDIVDSCRLSILKFRESSPEIYQKTQFLKSPGEQTVSQREAHQARLLAMRSRISS